MNIKIALGTLKSSVGNKRENLERALKAVNEAQRNGANLVAFGELYLSGYDCSNLMQKLAEPIPGPSTLRLIGECGCHIIMGMPERFHDRIYNAAALIRPKGSVGVYRKHFLSTWPASYNERALFDPGTDFPVWDINGWKVGVMICYDAFFPEVARALALKGAELIVCLAASADSQRDFHIYLPARASENTVFVAFVNLAGDRSDSKVFFGGSCILDPLGDVVAKAPYGGEGLTYATIDHKDLEKARSSRPLLDTLSLRMTERLDC